VSKVPIRSNHLKLQGDTVIPERAVLGKCRCWSCGVLKHSSGYSEESLASCVAVLLSAESILLTQVAGCGCLIDNRLFSLFTCTMCRTSFILTRKYKWEVRTLMSRM